MRAQYRGEVIERWGDTEAFRISEEKEGAGTAQMMHDAIVAYCQQV